MRIAIVQRRLTHYRVPLFERLRAALAQAGCDLVLVHGQPSPGEADKRDGGEIAWARCVRNRYVPAGAKYLCWQPLPEAVRRAELVIITQENSLLSNYPLLFRRRPGQRVAFWGHGANLQSGGAHGLRERFKRWTGNRVDWWFAYTQLSSRLVAEAGFPAERITVLNNAVDTSALVRDRSAIDAGQIARLRATLGFGDAPVGAFLGSLYADKRLDFLLAAAQRIRAAIPGFRLLVIGDGPERGKVDRWQREHPWVRWVGARSGREKMAHLATAQVLLNPGAVGLVMLDAFAAGVPLATTDCRIHGPEIAYLCNAVNGIMTSDRVEAYAEAVARLLRDPAQHARLCEACLAGAAQYSIEDMTRRFVAGIHGALAAPAIGACAVRA